MFEIWSWARYFLPTSSYLAPFHKAPQAAARQLLKLGRLCEDDCFVDLGCGNGALLTLAAAPPFNARGVGYELHPDLVREARARIQQLGLDSRLEVRQGDARLAEVKSATALLMYLSHDGNRLLYDALKDRLRPGTRLLCLAFPVAGLQASLQDQVNGLDLYVYHV